MGASHNTSRYNLPLPENPEFYDVEDIRNLSLRAEDALIGAQNRMDDLDSADAGQNERLEQLESGKVNIEYISYEGTGTTDLCAAPFTVRPDFIVPICKINLSTGKTERLDDIMHPAVGFVEEPCITEEGYGFYESAGPTYYWTSTSPAAQGNETGYKYYIAGVSRAKDATSKVETEMTLAYIGPDGGKHALSGITVSVNGKSQTADSDGKITLSGYDGQTLAITFKAVFPVFTERRISHILSSEEETVERIVFDMQNGASSVNPIITASTEKFKAAQGGYIPAELRNGTYLCDIVPVGGGGGGGNSTWIQKNSAFYGIGGGGGGGGYYPNKNDATYKGITVTSVGSVVVGKGGKGGRGVGTQDATDGGATSIMLNSVTYTMPGGKAAYTLSPSYTNLWGPAGNGGSGGGSGGSFNIGTGNVYYNSSAGAKNGQSAAGNGGGTGSGRVPVEVRDSDGNVILYGGGGGGGSSNTASISVGSNGGGNGGEARSTGNSRHGKPGSYGGGGGGAGAIASAQSQIGNGGDGGDGFIAVKVYLNENINS